MNDFVVLVNPCFNLFFVDTQMGLNKKSYFCNVISVDASSFQDNAFKACTL
jgi:hypothetical protein